MPSIRSFLTHFRPVFLLIGLWHIFACPFSAVAANNNAAKRAAPSAPSAKSANAISVLVIGGQNNHDWKIGNEFLLTLLNGQPGFSAVESNTPPKGASAADWAAWNPQFEKYQCVVLDYNGEMWPPTVQTAFENYVSSGGSVVVLHAANNSFTTWVEYEKMVGLLWRGRDTGASLYLDDAGLVVREEAGQGRPMGHGKQWDWQVTVRDPKHPIAAGMPLKWRHVKDELYHGQRGPAKDINILMSAFDDAKYQGTGKHEPVLWWVPYGKGKVLTNVMGHVGENSGPLSCVGFQTVFLRSIEWLVTGRCTTPIPADFPTEERTSQRYPGGIPRLPLADVAAKAAMAKIKVPTGYHLELVASDPMIVHPVMCTWDGNGRMYVAEMRTYMLDVDGRGENEPTSRVSQLTDTNGDGVMDRVTAFADNLVLPRMVLPLDDRVIIAETYTGNFESHRDGNGDGIADEKKLLFSGGATKANLEHQDTALQWGIDNYLYSGILGRRFRFTGEAMESHQIWGNSSQWGLAMDDLGRFFCSSAGGERPAYGFQQLPVYGNLSLAGETAEGFSETFPAVQTLDTQGGLNRVHNTKGTLNHFTAVAGQSIFRGDRLAKDFVGDYILPEPVGRLIRRAKVNNVDGKRVLTNATPGTEFITSTDLAFRPVWTATGPDGCLYIVDMHHGIIQESAWVTPGSYLRDTVVREGYDKYTGRGRIYRLVADGPKPGPKPNMLNETPAQWVAHLSHPNGWWRDTAQKLLVIKGDKSVVPALRKLVENSPSPLGRVHALWTLDGLGATNRELLIRAFSDKDDRVRSTAVRISEVYLRKGDAELVKLMAPLLKDTSIDVVVQTINSLRYVPAGAARPLVQAAAAAYLGNEIVTASAQQSLQFDPAKPTGIKVNIDPVGLALMKKGQEHYASICFACHGADGKGAVSSDKVLLAPPLAGSPRVIGSPEALVRIVLHGIIGDIDGKTYPGLMIPQKANDDLWMAQVLTYIRNSFGNIAPTITPENVAKIRKATGERPPYVMSELALFLAIPHDATKNWVFSASDNSKEAGRAFDGNPKSRWSTNKPREVGQWFQIDMGKPFEVSRLTIDTTDSKNDFPKKFELRKSDDGVKWSDPIYSGDGQTVINIDMPAKTVTRFFRLTQKTSQGGFWSIHELGVYGAEPQ